MPTVIVGLARTPIGRFGGVYQPLRAVDLGAAAMRGALERSGVDPARIDEVLFGHVLQAGAGQITSRQAAAQAGVPMTVPATTINKVCLSGMAAIAMGDRDIRLGEATFVLAGGMESMTNAPYVLPTGRWGARMGDATLVDSMTHDGLWCAFDKCTMGESSDAKNAVLGIGRAEQDEWAAESHRRAAAAAAPGGAFADEIVGVQVPQRKGDPLVAEQDEGVRADTTEASLAALRPAFASDGTITAGNASQISDGAAAVIVADRDAADATGAPVIAEILAYGQIGGIDATLHERPAEALLVALKKAGLEPSDLDLVEINEAFAAVALWSTRMLDIPDDPRSTSTAERSPWVIPWAPPAPGWWSAWSAPSASEVEASEPPPCVAVADRATPSSSEWPADGRADRAELRTRPGPGNRDRGTRAARWLGRGDKEKVDQAAVDGMRLHLSTLDINGVVVIGEGEKDEAPMLANGERVGSGNGMEVDVAVDPVDGTELTASGLQGAIAVHRHVGGPWVDVRPGPPGLYGQDRRRAGGCRSDRPRGAGSREPPPRRQARGKDVGDLRCLILDRERNRPHIDAVRAVGARISIFRDGDVAAAIATTEEDHEADIMLGIGGSPEAVIAAAALKCTGGELQCRLWPRNDEERTAAADLRLDLTQVMTIDDLVASDNVFFAATGVTTGELLDGVRFIPDGAETHTVVMRSRTGTVRFIRAQHRFDRLSKITSAYDGEIG
jgi:acetyl-CoA C-acetyltransferase